MNKTKAVKLLLESSCHEHYIISLNRCSKFKDELFLESENGLVIRYQSLPYGILIRYSLYRLAVKISRYLVKHKVHFDLIVAHKFTVEGIVAYHISNMLNSKYVISLWGSTDRKFLSLKPELRSLYRKIYSESECCFPASPWIHSYVEGKLGSTHGNAIHLPIITNNTELCISSTKVNVNFVTVFNLDLFKLKGFPCLVQSLSCFNEVDWKLDIIGAGSVQSISRINKIISKYNLTDRIRLIGTVDNSKITNVLSKYHSFLMPTTSETYGMVYLEALFSGIPILFSKEQGVDGYFLDDSVGVRVAANNRVEVVDGIKRLIVNRDSFVLNIKQYHKDGFFNKFTKNNIVKVFDESLELINA
ncbi:glycosyltransferase [Shewanella sp. HL-SH8]|uniref:glycosyltransferase n=1 Tax=Shewanella sp. HL-SH8 TaxID=3436242 RepID=UPI003EBE0576